MLDTHSRSYRILITSLVYVVAIAAALTIATLRSRAKAGAAPPQPYEEVERPVPTKPFFSLSTHRTYEERHRATLGDYQAWTSDFRSTR